jgi:flagellar basal body-associated protein FliL
MLQRSNRWMASANGKKMKNAIISSLAAAAVIAAAVSATAVALASQGDSQVENKFSVGMPVRPQMFYGQDPTASDLRPVNNGYAFSATLEDGKLRLFPHGGAGRFPRNAPSN